MIKFILFFTPLLPANSIYLGEHLPPIHAERQVCNSITGFCMLVTLSEFLQLKDIAQNQPDLCKIAVRESAQTCANEAQDLADLVSGREIETQKLIDAYQVQLADVDNQLLKSERRAQRWKWATFSTASVTILTTLILVIRE